MKFIKRAADADSRLNMITKFLYFGLQALIAYS